MKKLILGLVIVFGGWNISNAQGWCRIGKTKLSPNGNKTYTLSCVGYDGICYETDNNGNTSPGSEIKIHLGDEIIIGVIVAAESNNLENNTPKNQPTDLLPETAIVEIQ